MTTRSVAWLGLLPCWLLLGACQAEDDRFSSSNSLDQIDNVRVWATTGSAVAVYSHAYTPLSFADGRSSFPDPGCPRVTDDGTTAGIVGDCSEASGTQWIGSAEVVRSSNGERQVTLTGFGEFDDPGMRSATTGTVVRRQPGPTSYQFDVDLVTRGGMTTTIQYTGQIEGGYDTATVWNGSGTVSRDGMVTPVGTIHVTTQGEVVDNSICSGQPVSGQTTIFGGTQTAVVTYDGATDCDADAAGSWSLDGVPRGRITGLTCATRQVGGGGRSCAGLALLGAIGLIGSLRRRAFSRLPTEPAGASGTGARRFGLPASGRRHGLQ